MLIVNANNIVDFVRKRWWLSRFAAEYAIHHKRSR